MLGGRDPPDPPSGCALGDLTSCGHPCHFHVRLSSPVIFGSRDVDGGHVSRCKVLE